ncbi:microtubule-associated tumor suppressor candidate 2 isoform X1 [Sinocyclocheilus anshuiensis]|uniref:microtubule-associated tumor suppressor candidate 2 isoform X1 n=1 Tax=Sinocyclocheilus anshuiensis TaxID=1608454 RepID=UPI0007B9CB00|nr:PREDICTED: microtubule-associated tumor suppressor candidate 2-like isoform X1 [Sinocyclocheilus anshuiensis]
MNVQGKIQVGEVNQQEEIQNDDKQSLIETVEDANANQITKENIYSDDREHGSPLPPLVSHSEAQESIIIWGTHARCEDPELEEFELLECQELETFVVEEEEQVDMQSERSRKGAKNFREKEFSSTAISTTIGSPWKDHNENHNVDGDANENSQPLDLRTSSSRSGANRTLRDARSGSEGNVFSSSLSAVTSLSGSLASALDSAGRTQPLSSQSTKSTSDKGRNQHPATTKSYIHSERNRELPSDLDQNHNSTTLPQEPQYDRSKLMHPSYGAVKLQKFQMKAEQNAGKRMSTEVPKGMLRVLPSCRQLVRPLSTEKRLTSGYPSIDTQADQQQSHSSEKGQSHPQVLPTTEVYSNPNADSQTPPNQAFTREAQCLKRQSSADRPASPSSLERKTHFSRRAYSSPTRPLTPPSPKTTRSPQRQPPSSPIKTLPSRGPQLGYAGYSLGLRAPVKTTINTSIHKTPPQQALMETSPPSKCLPKPKSVRPKIITYIRKTPQVKPQSFEGTYEVSSLATRLSTYSSTQAKPAVEDQGEATVLSASNLLYDKYRQEMQKVRFFSPGLMMSGIKPPSNTMPHKMTGRADSFYGSLNKPLSAAAGRSPLALGSPVSGAEDPSGPPMGAQDMGSLYRPPRGLRPQLGVGAVNRTPSATAKNRMVLTGQPKSPLTLSQPVQAVNPTTQTPQEPQDQRKSVMTGLAAKSLLPKPAQSGLRPPGYSRLPPARLAAFGFVRSSSVSSVSSNHSTDSTWSDPCRPAYCPNSVSDEPPPLHRVTTSPPGNGSRAPCRSTPQPPNTPAPTRRSLLPPPRSSPVASRKEFQKSSDGTCSSLSSPKRLAVVSPKPQSPVLQRQQRATVVVRGSSMQILPRTGSPGPEKQKEEEQKKEKEREEVERNEEIQLLQGRCEEQARQLQTLQTELKKTSMSLEVFVVCTQHFALKSESAEEKERELSQELSRIQHEVAFNAARWERLQKEKRELVECFERELRELQVQQESELTTVEENLRLRHTSDRDYLRAEHQSEVEELRTQHQEQIEELTANHEAALEDLKTMHNITMSTLQEEHARTMRDLRKAHEQQKASLEEDFEKLRLSLQDQVDTLTFQNRTLKDKAKRFEEALRKSTDEQIVDVLAPYQHIEEDLKSLKEVLEMKNKQIHDQEKKICHLEKVQAQKNLYLEERVQVLQQQNEDLMARIDRHLTVSRQLSEENANLQEYVEKETNEKKRLSRNNEELLWLLQTSPHLSPSSSPIHRAFFPGPDIPPYPYSPGPGTPTHSCSPGPSPAPGTPTLRGSPAARSSPARIPNANTFSR